MNDLISYCPDIEKLRKELKDKGYVDEDDNPVFPLMNHTPIQEANKPETITLIRCVNQADCDVLNSFTSLEVLGTYDEVFADPDKYAKYSSAYPHDETTETDPDTGETTTITPPKKFGVFL